jgi:hypothetical protein
MIVAMIMMMTVGGDDYGDDYDAGHDDDHQTYG